jgi:hypothetical protein
MYVKVNCFIFNLWESIISYILMAPLIQCEGINVKKKTFYFTYKQIYVNWPLITL